MTSRSALRFLVVCLGLLGSLLCFSAANASELPAWAIDVPGLGVLSLHGQTPRDAVRRYVDGLIRRNAFPGRSPELRAWAAKLDTSTARSLSTEAAGRPLSGIQLNSANDLLGSVDYLATRRFYADGVRATGMAAAFMPPADSRALIGARLGSVQHLLLTGGDDIHPALYKQPLTHAHPDELNLVRDRYERALVRAAIDSKLPVDGTCRGFQMMNVATGGTLVQDIHEDGLTGEPHAAPGFLPLGHAVALEPGSELARTLGTTVDSVPSMHHEALGRAGRGLRIVGRAPDGVPEALEGDSGRLRGYQFHAERALGAPFSNAIFGSIAARATAYARTR